MLNRRHVLALPFVAGATRSARAGDLVVLNVLATFSVLADLSRHVGQERVSTESLIPPDGDAHTFQPSPADALRMSKAQVVLANGLGFDDWINRLAKASGAETKLVVASKGVAARQIDDVEDKQKGRRLDPHAWLSIPNAKRYVETIRAAFTAADPEGLDAYKYGANDLTWRLDALDIQIRTTVANLPKDRRTIVTTHDAFGYFAAEYGLTFVAPNGVSSEAEASPKDVARIIRQIKAEKIPAVFLENVTDPRLMERIAQETGARIGGKLYSDSLSPPDGPAPTYLTMMQHNIRVLREALAP